MEFTARGKGLGRLAAMAALATFLASAVQADVTVRGTVTYWDRLAGMYKPANNCRVEVEGDWWWRGDPNVQTNASGQYQASVENPPWWWNNYDHVHIDAYAETPDRFHIYENMFAFWTYNASSSQTNDVKGDRTVQIDLRIGGSQNNVHESYIRGAEETANAFVVREEMRLHYQKLRDMGWSDGDFPNAKVIIPAATPTGISYTNHFTGFINLAMASAGLAGTGPWVNLPTTPDGDGGGYNFFLMTCRHEFSHLIHNHLSSWPLLGLNMPSYHGPNMETNRYLAWTEGFAEFLPLATLNNGGQYARIPVSALGMPAGGNHYAMEGEVAGLLWSIFDPASLAKELRHKPTQALDKNGSAVPLPAVIQTSMPFQDRIGDGGLSRVKQVVRTGSNTIGDFLGEYKNRFPGDVHAIKTLAFNRDISMGLPAETAPSLSGQATLTARPATAQGIPVQLDFTIHEPDAEDRSFVQTAIWLQQGAGQPIRQNVPMASAPNSTGPDRACSYSVFAHAAGDKLWLVLSDDMLMTAYVFDVPAAPAGQPIRHGPFDISKFANLTLTAQDRPIKPKLPAGSTLPFVGEDANLQKPSEQDGQKAAKLRDLIDQASLELNAYAERKKMLERHEAGMYKLAKLRGGLSAADDYEKLLGRPVGKAAGPAERLKSPAETPALKAYNDWLGQTAAGKPLSQPLQASDKGLLDTNQKLLARQADEQQSAAGRIPALIQQIQSAMDALPAPPGSSIEIQGTKQTLPQLQQALNALAGDTELVTRLRQHTIALKTLAK